jgi:hypothetical protein
MESNVFKWTVRTFAVLILTVGVGAYGQDWAHNEWKFSGVINAYSPQTATGTGPYEIRGPWSLTLRRDGTKADFSAALDMEFSDGWVLTTGKMNFDPKARGAHTHHITLEGADVTPIANGFRVTGPAVFTLNGGSAPPTVSPSAVVIEVTGGSEVAFSNITLTFQKPGSNHFGSAPLPGVVRSVKEEHDRRERR